MSTGSLEQGAGSPCTVVHKHMASHNAVGGMAEMAMVEEGGREWVSIVKRCIT